MELHEIREEIRQIDEEMAELFVRRMEAVRKVAAYKNQRGLLIGNSCRKRWTSVRGGRCT